MDRATRSCVLLYACPAILLAGLALVGVAAAPPTTVTTVAPHTVSSGVAVTADASDSTNGNKTANDGATRLVVINASGATRTLTITPKATFWNGQLSFAAYTKTIADGKVGIFGPFPTALFNDGSGDLWYSIDSDTNVTITPVKD